MDQATTARQLDARAVLQYKDRYAEYGKTMTYFR
jgi:hypothetical protein